MTDIGTGTYTIMTQIAAEVMQVPLTDVKILMGDTDYPPTPGSGGSFGANSAGSGLYEACMNLRQKLIETAISDKQSPLFKLKAKDADFKDGHVVIANASDSFQAIASRAGGTLTAKGKIGELKTYKTYSQAAYGAHFAEVGVDSVTGEVRLRRMLGVFAAGRILNMKTARSQAIGGMLWGVSSALLEEAVADARYGQFVNHDLAEYHVPVHADAVNVEAIYLPEIDDKTGPLKIKGVGELGICGAGAAIANAVYNACGVRVREYPITLDKVLKGLA
jgi:xanthine dehydrogenase YagR molybdenum-binding subunit